jgi:uncharacterized protein
MASHPHDTEAFPREVIDKLQHYVYRLLDPSNGETFYVGRGQGNRVFAHIRDELGSEGDDLSDKLQRIRDIRLAGLQVGHVIHRHGMNKNTAEQVEAALIDAYPGLTNAVNGYDSGDIGVMHVREILTKYAAPVAVFHHNVVLISVNHTASQQSLYEATRYSWKVNPERARRADLVLATVRGLIKGAFVAEKWKEATVANFPGRQPVPGRYGFEGFEAPAEVQRQYVNKRVPDSLRKRGAANPIKYVAEQSKA